jgi:hypothetical protein
MTGRAARSLACGWGSTRANRWSPATTTSASTSIEARASPPPLTAGTVTTATATESLIELRRRQGTAAKRLDQLQDEQREALEARHAASDAVIEAERNLKILNQLAQVLADVLLDLRLRVPQGAPCALDLFRPTLVRLFLGRDQRLLELRALAGGDAPSGR